MNNNQQKVSTPFQEMYNQFYQDCIDSAMKEYKLFMQQDSRKEKRVLRGQFRDSQTINEKKLLHEYSQNQREYLQKVAHEFESANLRYNKNEIVRL
jgi:hypothetical protein